MYKNKRKKEKNKLWREDKVLYFSVELLEKESKEERKKGEKVIFIRKKKRRRKERDRIEAHRQKVIWHMLHCY